MKLLLDTCLSLHARRHLESCGNDVVSSADWPADPGDEAILRLAGQETRVLLTLDKDFGELAIVRGLRHNGIIRLVGFRAVHQGAASQEVLTHYAGELLAGALITITPGRVRIRPAD